MVYEGTVEGNTAAGAQWGVWFMGNGAPRHLSKHGNGCTVGHVVTGNGAPRHLSPGLALTQAQQSSSPQDRKHTAPILLRTSSSAALGAH